MWRWWNVSWLLVKAHVRALLARPTIPLLTHWTTDRAHTITSEEVADGWTSVTFEHRGKVYRGHAPPGARLEAQPWYQGARVTMRRPKRAYDGRGRDVTDRVKQYWGPCGDWNAAVGLRFRPAADPRLVAPVTVSFNDLSVDVVD